MSKDVSLLQKAKLHFRHFTEKLAFLFSFVEFSKHGQEYESSVLRFSIVNLTILIIFISYENLRASTLLIMSTFTIYSVLSLIHVRKYPEANPIRLRITMLMDVLGTSISLYHTNDVGGILVGIYLWIVIGYGYRYGKNMLISSYIASLIGFVVASQLSPYWNTHIAAFFGLLFTLVTIPLYALSLLNKLQSAVKKAEAASQAKSEFLSHISHEIRTPLNGIVGACQLLEASNLNKDHKALFNVMKSSSNVLLELVNNVLDLSKIESGKVVNHTEDFYLQSLLSTTVNLFESQASQKGISLAYEISNETPLRIHGNLMHTKQVLINLVGNAVKFTEQGAIKIKVFPVEQSNSQATLRFEVVDTGTGIAADSLPHIFESFVQAKESKYKFGGTGLGTTISKNLVELMHGKIGVESTYGQGSTFWFEIPFEKLSSSNAGQENISSEIIPFKKIEASSKNPRYHILVAEDNETNILIISQMLDMLKHTYEIVKNGELVLDQLRDNAFDLMILDYNMPVMGGLEALKIYQSINVGQPQVPAIILTADATNDTRALFDNLNVGAFLTKPLQADVLTQAISNVAVNKTLKQAKVIQYHEIAQSKAHASKPVTPAPVLDVKASPHLDISRLESLSSMSKSPDFLQNLIQGFITDTEQNFSTLVTDIIMLDYPKINDCGHAIAGSASNIGANDLAQLCRKLNHVKPSDNVNLEELLSNALDSYEKTKLSLMHYLTQRNSNANRSIAQ